MDGPQLLLESFGPRLGSMEPGAQQHAEATMSVREQVLGHERATGLVVSAHIVDVRGRRQRGINGYQRDMPLLYFGAPDVGIKASRGA